MVDLAFLLITFFMLSTSFSKSKAIKLSKPPIITEEQKELFQDQIKEDQTLTIYVYDNDLLFYGVKKSEVFFTDYAQDGIQKIVAEANKKTKNKLTLLIKMHPNASTKNLVDILDVYHQNALNLPYFLGDISKEQQVVIEKFIKK